ncbi:MAG: DUF362 domain-containing protein [Clostridia bacterium]|nr:DUF362 domain-containing protein [Clostridia bacterium]
MSGMNTVVLSRAEEYDFAAIKSILAMHFGKIGVDAEFFAGKKVAIKPNLVMKKEPEAAATTHPVVLDALLSLLADMGVTPVIAESPGGVYTQARMEGIYKVCGITAVAEKYGDILNKDISWKHMHAENALVCHEFDIITPLYEADVIIDLCKLKSHSLTKMSAAVKNFYGSVPGITKFEMHAAFPENERFIGMICDLCKMLCEKKEIIAVTDAIIGMEGNGPTGGEPRKIGCILTSRNPFASDLLAEKILGFEGTVPMVREAAKRGYMPATAAELDIIGESPKELIVKDFAQPDSTKGGGSMLVHFTSGKWGEIFAPKPKINLSVCRGCGECAASCPQHTIEMRKNKNGKKYAHIIRKKCIRCFCCQELCPFVAIGTKKNVLLNVISAFK